MSSCTFSIQRPITYKISSSRDQEPLSLLSNASCCHRSHDELSIGPLTLLIMPSAQETVVLSGHIIDSLNLAKVLDTILMVGDLGY